MKKWNVLANVLICGSLSLWAIQALLSYHNYTRHIELYAAQGWLWYADVFTWGMYIVPLVVVCLIAKFLFRRK